MHSLSSEEEFPILFDSGLYAATIRGDGNCLFNALSDQLYGDETQHATIRARTVDYMREHADQYKPFISGFDGNGLRRNPKRKNASTYASPVTTATPSPEDIDRLFDRRLENMAKGGVWGDNMEISAFAAAYNTDVKIWQTAYTYEIPGGDNDPSSPRPIAHIAYHTWEHYSSVRNRDGPHTGLPNVQARRLTSEEEAHRAKFSTETIVHSWQIDVIQRSLPYFADKSEIKQALIAANGNMHRAMNTLLDASDTRSTSSRQEYSSIERDRDSDDDEEKVARKRRSKRKHRTQGATASQHMLSQEVDDQSSTSSGSYESASSQHSLNTRPTSEELDKADKKITVDLTTASTQGPRPRIIKILPPRPPPQLTPLRLSRTSTPLQKDIIRHPSRPPETPSKPTDEKTPGVSSALSTEQAAHQAAALALREQGQTNTPPVAEGIRALWL